MLVSTGELLLSTENTLAVIFLCSCCCVCSAFFQSIRQRPPGYVLHRVPQPVVPRRARTIHTARCIWGQFLHRLFNIRGISLNVVSLNVRVLCCHMLAEYKCVSVSSHHFSMVLRPLCFCIF